MTFLNNCQNRAVKNFIIDMENTETKHAVRMVKDVSS